MSIAYLSKRTSMISPLNGRICDVSTCPKRFAAIPINRQQLQPRVTCCCRLLVNELYKVLLDKNIKWKHEKSPSPSNWTHIMTCYASLMLSTINLWQFVPRLLVEAVRCMRQTKMLSQYAQWHSSLLGLDAILHIVCLAQTLSLFYNMFINVVMCHSNLGWFQTCRGFNN